MINPTKYADISSRYKQKSRFAAWCQSSRTQRRLHISISCFPPIIERYGGSHRLLLDDGARSREILRPQLINILEFGFGYGCVSSREGRFDLTASDIHPSVMDFLASLGMKTLQSAHIPEEFHCPSNFDVCFALSFFSHMPNLTWSRWSMF